MWWLSALGTLLLATILTGLPVSPDPDAELAPKVVENETPSRELQPPSNDVDSGAPKHGMVFLVNLYTVTNSLDLDDVEERLTNEIVEGTPAKLEPMGKVLMIFEADDEDIPVNLEEFGEILEDDGYVVEKVVRDGEIKLFKVNAGNETDDESMEDLALGINSIETNTVKVRRKRAPCRKCHGNTLGGGGEGYGGGGYGGGGYSGGGHGGGSEGGGNGIVPLVTVPVQIGGGGGYPSGGGGGGRYPSGGGGHYPSGGGAGGHYHPGGDGGQCAVCQGQRGGGHGGGGGGGSYSQASAQASAQSSSGGW